MESVSQPKAQSRHKLFIERFAFLLFTPQLLRYRPVPQAKRNGPHKLTPKQMQWLSLVREHLLKNLSLDEEGFDLTPLLQMRRGKAKARQVFQNQLEPIITFLNSSVAA